MTLVPNSRSAIRTKVEMLRSRIWKMATISAAVAANPVSGVSVLFDTAMLAVEAERYKKTLGLDTESLDNLAKICGVTRQMIDNKFTLIRNFDPMLLTNLSGFISKLLVTYATAQVGEETARLIPVVGWFAAGSISFYTIYRLLHDLLNRMEEAAILLFESIMSKNSEPAVVDGQDADLSFEIGEIMENTHQGVLLSDIVTTVPSTVTILTPPVKIRNENSVNDIDSPKSSYCPCLRRKV